MLSPPVQLHDQLRKILLGAMRGHGKNSGRGLPVRPPGLQRQGALTVAADDSLQAALDRVGPITVARVSRAFAAGAICLAIGAFTGCANGNSKSLDLTDRIRRDLDQSGLREVTVS